MSPNAISGLEDVFLRPVLTAATMAKTAVKTQTVVFMPGDLVLVLQDTTADRCAAVVSRYAPVIYRFSNAFGYFSMFLEPGNFVETPFCFFIQCSSHHNPDHVA